MFCQTRKSHQKNDMEERPQWRVPISMRGLGRKMRMHQSGIGGCIVHQTWRHQEGQYNCIRGRWRQRQNAEQQDRIVRRKSSLIKAYVTERPCRLNWSRLVDPPYLDVSHLRLPRRYVYNDWSWPNQQRKQDCEHSVTAQNRRVWPWRKSIAYLKDARLPRWSLFLVPLRHDAMLAMRRRRNY